MHAGKALLVVVVVGLLVAVGGFTFVPKTRPAIVQKWFLKGAGFSEATSPEDALDKLKLALEKRNYEAVKLYITGDYVEWFNKGYGDALELVKAVDELRDVMKTTGTKSDKADFVLFMLDPFPPFKVGDSKKSEKAGVAWINWTEDIARYRGTPSVSDWRVNNLLYHALLPSALLPPMQVTVKQTDGGWKVEIPVQIGDRHVRDTVEALRKNATNYRNALREIKQNLKNNATTKEDFEHELKVALEKSN